LKLLVLRDRFAICLLDRHAPVPVWAMQDDLYFIARTADELSLICPEANVPNEGIRCARGWRCLEITEPYPLDFSLVGALASILSPLSAAGISSMAVSTYNTDYLLVESDKLDRAVHALEQRGIQVIL
jgi:uncharacterized protein